MMLPLPVDGSIVWFVLCWLASWRITALFCYDAGPFQVFTRLRRLLARIGLGRLITCFHCTAIWVSALVVGVLFEMRWTTGVVFLAVAGAVSITERWLGGAAAEPSERNPDG
jgi:hypothetical protein